MAPRRAEHARAPALGGSIARVTPEASGSQGREREREEADEGRWSALLPELLADILRRVDAGAERWPARRDVVACACVCRRWREATVAMVRPPLDCGGITFLSSLKQPGPRDTPIQCFIRRDRKKSIFYLYLSLTQALAGAGKFLLAARRIRNGLCLEYIISSQSDDHSHRSYVGKLKSDFTRTKFTLYDRQPLRGGSKVPRSRSTRQFMGKQINPLVSTDNFEIARVSYEYNLLKSRGPRKIQCRIEWPLHEGTSMYQGEVKQLMAPTSSLLLNSKKPQWHEHLQCWYLNFHGRVMVASVKNFQLAVPADTGQSWGVQDDETEVLQFGKVDDEVFTMDYRQPLSAFQAFAICLTSFGSKIGRE